ncbi:peptidase E [Bacteroidia bacterium]|nr:peptidase E [Bacteroidia bacterium]
MRKLLLISNSTNPGEPYLGWCNELLVQWTRTNTIKTALFVPFAGVTTSWDDYEAKVQKVFSAMGIQVRSIHHDADAKVAVEQAECIIVGGGNTWRLLNECQVRNILPLIRTKALNGTPYIGWSAGSNLACPTIKTTNDMPIVEPQSFDALNLIPFQINPHYLDAHPQGHGGETREARIQEFIVLNTSVYVAGLREATALVVDNNDIQLVGREKSMRVFKHNLEPKEYPIGSPIIFLLD